MSSTPTEGEFKEEVLRLFALEALEWIRQIKAAILELEGTPSRERCQVLYELILRNLTNLKGSAATVDLPSIGNLAFLLVPLLQSMQKEQVVRTSQYYGPLRQGLDALSSVIQVLAMAETKLPVIDDLESITRRQADALQSMVTNARRQANGAEKTEADGYSVPVAKVIETLLKSKRARSAAPESSRRQCELILRKIYAMTDLDTATIQGVSLAHVLQELEDLDERFADEARQRSVAIDLALRDTQTGEGDAAGQQKRVRECLREIAFLHAAAVSTDALELARFLHGLETILVAVLYKGMTVTRERIESIRERLSTLAAAVPDWIEAGRKERAEIEKILIDVLGPQLDLKKPSPSLISER